MMVGQRAAVMLQDGTVLAGFLRSATIDPVEVPSPVPGQRHFIEGPMTLHVEDAIRIMPAYGPHVPTLIPEAGGRVYRGREDSPWFAGTAGDTEAGEIP